MDTEAITFTASAVGYPDVQLLMWKTGTGEMLSLDSQYNVSVTRQAFNITVVSSLTVGRQQCCLARGFMAIFTATSGNTTDTIHCPPGKWQYGYICNTALQYQSTPTLLSWIGPPCEPEVLYMKSNNTICVDAYSNPDYPVEHNSLSITDVTTVWLNHTVHSHTLNGSECIAISNDMYPHACIQLHLEVTASNALGNSSKGYTIIQGCLSLLLVEVVQLTCSSGLDDPLCHKLLLMNSSLGKF